MSERRRIPSWDWKTRIRRALFGLSAWDDGTEYISHQNCKPYRLYREQWYREHFICLDCRKGFKGIGGKEAVCPDCGRQCRDAFGDACGDKCPDCGEDISWMSRKDCPECGRQMVPVPKDFPVPRKNNLRAWNYIRELVS